MPPRPLMDEAGIRDWILRTLGAPFWKIELTCDHLDDAISDAKRWFSAKKGLPKMMQVTLADGQQQYALPDDAEIVLDVADSWRFGQMPNLSFDFGFDQIVMDRDFASSKWPLSGWMQRMQYAQSGGAMLDSLFEWEQHGRVLHVLTPNPRTVVLTIFYKSNQIVIDQLSEMDYDLVRRYALMRAKHVLGRVRSKWPGGMPSAQGTVDMDGQVLLEEARAEAEQLENDIRQTAMPVPFIQG